MVVRHMCRKRFVRITLAPDNRSRRNDGPSVAVAVAVTVAAVVSEAGLVGSPGPGGRDHRAQRAARRFRAARPVMRSGDASGSGHVPDPRPV
ncbi:hypothetical protein GCM10010398_49190 [Streptomyces fimbriatus]